MTINELGFITQNGVFSGFSFCLSFTYLLHMLKICLVISKIIRILYYNKLTNKQKQNKMTRKENDELQKELDYQMELFHKKRREVYEKEQKELDELMKLIDELN